MKAKANKKIAGLVPKSRTATVSDDTVSAEYSQTLKDIGRPLSCKISVVTTRPSGEFSMLDVREVRKTVSYPYENGGIGYKTLTHLLEGDSISYGLACSSDGEVEIYLIEEDDSTVIYDSEFVGGARVQRHIVDPMFAFSTADSVYVVFNNPTDFALDSGAKARKPISFPEENMVIAAGAPVAVRFEIGEERGTSVLPLMEKLNRYVISLLDDPEGEKPLVMVANILNYSDEDEPEEPGEKPSFGRLINSVIFSDEFDVVKARDDFPIGISVAKFGKDTNYEQVPMSGNLKYGILGITISESEDGENNAVNIEAAIYNGK